MPPLSPEAPQDPVEAAAQALLAGCALTFVPATDQSDAVLLIYRPDGQPIADIPAPAPLATATYELVLTTETGTSYTAPVLGWTMPTSISIPALQAAGEHHATHPSATTWSRAARLGLRMVAARLVYPALTDRDADQWRAGPWPASVNSSLDALASAMSLHAHCTVIDDPAVPEPVRIPEPRAAIDEFVHTLADTLVRTPTTAALFPHHHYADTNPRELTPEQRAVMATWTDQIEDHLDEGPLPSLILDIDEPDSTGSLTARLQLATHRAADSSGVHPPVPAEHVWTGRTLLPGFDRTTGRDRVRRALRRAARGFPELEPLASQQHPTQMTIDGQVLRGLLDAAPDLAERRLTVRGPAGLTTTLTTHAVLDQHQAGHTSDRPPRFALAELVTFRWQFALAGQDLTEAEMNALADAARPLVRIRGQWILVDDALASRARQRCGTPIPAGQALTAALTGTFNVQGGAPTPCRPGGRLADIVTTLRAGENATDSVLPAPTGLNAELRQYQQRALTWLSNLTALGFGGVLADDMGLGKTLTALAYTLHRSQNGAEGPTLVICPASLVTNWSREAGRFAPTLPVVAYHGTRRTLDDLPANGLVITTYGVMRRDHEQLAARHWSTVIADEAQMAKNPKSATARQLRTIPAHTRIALTGTPIENNLSDLWALIDWTNPGLLGSLAQFRARYANAAERDSTGPEAQRLARLTAPFVLRRLKTDPRIAPELPEKVHSRRIVQLTHEQAGLYEAMVRETLDTLEGATGITRHGLVLKLITGLKQISNHPAHYLRENPVSASTGSTFAARSAKLAALDDIIDNVTANNEAVLIFSSYVAMGRLLAAHLTHRGHRPEFLHGGLGTPRRQQIIDAFQDGRTNVLILSLKAAGTGLNLTRASHVVHYDRQWNPAIEDQATDRAHRLGSSHRTVTVHHLLTEGTVEDRIAALLTHKRTLANAILTTGDRALSKLSNEELAELVALGDAA